MSRHTAIYLTLTLTLPAAAADMPHGGSQHLMINAHQLELRDTDEGRTGSWDIEAWYGGDQHKAFLHSEGERHRHETESAETRAGWQTAIAPFWDLQLGWRRDWQPDAPNRDWGMLALAGTAPYFIDTRLQLFAGNRGRLLGRVEVEKELLLSQRLHLVPALEATVASKADAASGLASGLNTVEAGLRLRYELRREFAPYAGIHWEKRYHDAARQARRNGEDTEDAVAVIGIHWWF